MTKLYLIRHGEAYGNVEPVLAGPRGDRGLTPRGVAQAERLRDRLAATREIAANVLISSPLPRARQTAEIIAPALGLPIIFECEVEELRLGEADGMTTQEAWERFGFPDFRNNPLRPIAPGGEGWGQFTLRVGLALDRIIRDHEDKTVVIVCHGGVIDMSFLYFFQMPTLVLPPLEFHTHNTSITYWERLGPARGQRWRLVSYNDTTHLREIGSAESIRWEDVSPEPQSGSDRPAVPLPTEE